MVEVDENTAAINQEAIARADADSANASLIETVRAESNQNNQDLRALVVDESNARIDADRLLAERVTGVEVITNPDMIGSTDDLIGSESGNAGVWSILSAVREGDLFQAQRTDLLTVSVNNNAANILTEQTARVSADDALSERIDSLNVEFNGNTASINQKLQSLADVDQALTSEISGMNTRVGANEANIISESQARSTGDVANAQALTDYRSINDTALANVRQTAESAVTATSANTQAVQALDSRIVVAEGNANTAKTNAATALTKAETATTQAGSAASLATQASAIANQASNTADTANQTAATALSTANVAATQSGANATRLDAITLELGDKASTGALSQTDAKVAEHEGKISANTTKIDGVYAQVNPKLIGSTEDLIGSTEGFAGTWTLQSALIEGDMAQAQRTDQIVATINENDAIYQQQIKATADAISANVQTTNTLQTTVGQNTASIQEVSQSVNGLYAQKYIKLDVNGKVAGWGGVNDGKESNFILNFDSFAIGSGNSTGYYPFIFRNTPFTDPVTGTVFPVSAYLKSAMMDYQSVKTSHIEDLAVKTAKIDKLAVKTAQIDDLAVTTSKIGDLQVDTLKIKDNAVTVPVSAFAEAAIQVGSGYTTIQTLYVPADMGHTILTFGAVFSFNSFDTKQQILCRVLKNGNVVFENLEVFYLESNTVGKTTSLSGSHSHGVSVSFSGNTSNEGSHSHSVSVSGNTGSTNAGGTFHSHSFSDSAGTNSAGTHSHSFNVNSSSFTSAADPGHTHSVNIDNQSRGAGTMNISRHDSTGIAGTFQLQLIAVTGGNISVSQRYIHAMTMRK